MNEMVAQTERFIEVDFHQVFKSGQKVGGDVFMSEKIDQGNRIIMVLSDGLGSGIKASVLATLTATMSMRFVANFRNLKSVAPVIMGTLPVCKERRISYSTFTIVDIDMNGEAKIMEYGNPSFLIIRKGEIINVPKIQQEIFLENEEKRIIDYSEFVAEFGDRMVFCSDGVTQAGMGESLTPLGWQEDNLATFVCDAIKSNSDISARKLAHTVVQEALSIDRNVAKDDITCGVLYLRRPRKTLLVSGPPIKSENDSRLAQKVRSFTGEKIVCGGTTANILSREWDEKIVVEMDMIDTSIPPFSFMEGVSLVTEGILTLCRVSEILDKDVPLDSLPTNAASKILDLLMNSDDIHFLVGTKINEVHQDPNMPMEIEIRRTIIKKIKWLLEKKFLKKVTLEYI